MQGCLLNYYVKLSYTAIIIVILSDLQGCGLASARPAISNINNDSGILEALSVSGKLSLQMFVAPCVNDNCPIQLRLMQDKKAIDSKNLDWGAVDKKSQRGSWTGLWDTAHGKTLPAVTLGEERNAITTAMQPVRLNNNRMAVLVRQTGGFEHVKRRFYLYAIRNKQLKRIWTGKEGAGSFYSGVVVVDMAVDRKGIIYFNGFSKASYSEADSLDVKQLHWPMNSQDLVEESAVGLPVVLLVPEYDSVGAARSALAQAATCLANYWILKSGQFSGLSKNKVVIAAIATSEQWVKAELVRLRKCRPELKIKQSITSAPN